jgi:hypothetical protein
MDYVEKRKSLDPAGNPTLTLRLFTQYYSHYIDRATRAKYIKNTILNRKILKSFLNTSKKLKLKSPNRKTTGTVTCQ